MPPTCLHGVNKDRFTFTFYYTGDLIENNINFKNTHEGSSLLRYHCIGG